MSQLERTGHSRGAERTVALTPKGETRYGAVVGEFTKLAEKPMAGDQKMGAFYTAVVDLAQNNTQFNSLIKTAAERDTTADHMANLLLRGVQYIEIFKNNRRDYDESFTEPAAWKNLLMGANGVVTNHGEQLQDILATRETTTTKYPRYAGVKAALNALFPNQDVKVADFGCGANYGLQGLRGDIPFSPVETDTDNDGGTETGHRAKKITSLISERVSLAEGFAVDKTDPSGQDERNWRIACSFYPSELSLNNLRDLKTLEDTIAGIDQAGMRFLQGNLLELQTNHADGTLPEEHFDAVIMSTILYQMTSDEQVKMIETAKKSLNPNGVIILQDFAAKSTDKDHQVGLDIKGLNPEPYSYRTFVMAKDETEWREFLKWKNGRCRQVQSGEDFDRVKSITRTPPTDPIPLFTAA
jgi:hypothetical protein